MIQPEDIERAYVTNAKETEEAGSIDEWLLREGFASTKASPVLTDITAELIFMALAGIEIDVLLGVAFQAGLSIGWTLHRDSA